MARPPAYEGPCAAVWQTMQSPNAASSAPRVMAAVAKEARDGGSTGAISVAERAGGENAAVARKVLTSRRICGVRIIARGMSEYERQFYMRKPRRVPPQPRSRKKLPGQ